MATVDRFFPDPFGQRVLGQATLVDQPLQAQGDLYGVEVLPLDVLDDGHFEQRLVVRFTDVGGDHGESGLLRGSPTPFSADEGVGAVSLFLDGDRLYDPEGTDGFGQLLEGLLGKVTAGLFRIGLDAVYLDLLESPAFTLFGQHRSFHVEDSAQSAPQTFIFRIHGYLLLFVSVFFDELFGEVQVVDASRRGGVVEQSRLTETRSFAQPDVALDDRLESELSEVFFDLVGDLVGQSEPRVVHRQQESFDFQRRVEFRLGHLDGVEQFPEPLECKVFALYGNQDAVRSD